MGGGSLELVKSTQGHPGLIQANSPTRPNCGIHAQLGWVARQLLSRFSMADSHGRSTISTS
jgi:hypothetical protein